MAKPAARVADPQQCDLVDIDGAPHGGGAIVGPGALHVLIGGQPAACVGDLAECVGAPEEPNAIAMGSCRVFFGSRPAARLGDMMAHGGFIIGGYPRVLIGG